MREKNKNVCFQKRTFKLPFLCEKISVEFQLIASPLFFRNFGGRGRGQLAGIPLIYIFWNKNFIYEKFVFLEKIYFFNFFQNWFLGEHLFFSDVKVDVVIRKSFEQNILLKSFWHWRKHLLEIFEWNIFVRTFWQTEFKKKVY